MYTVCSTVFVRRIIRVFVALFVVVLCSIVRGGMFEGDHVQAATCGDGVIEGGEACDDGNLTVSDGCSATCTVEQECYDAGNTFSFFTWGDSYTSAGDGGVMDVFADAVNKGKYPSRIVPRFWISNGDIPFMVDGNATLDTLNNNLSGLLYPFQCMASTRQFPYFVAIGNHDVDGYSGINGTTPQSQYTYWRTVVGPKLATTLVGLQNFRQGPTSSDGHDALTTYSFDYKNAHLVVVNQYHQDPSYPTSNPLGCIRQPLYDWINQDLAQTSRPLKFVFGHEPAWSYCSAVSGYGGSEFCPIGSIDNQNPGQRPRPYSVFGPWLEPYGRHWSDSLSDNACPDVTGGAYLDGRDAFWSMLASHGVVAHFNGHTHTYSSRLVQGNLVRRNEIGAYNKTGQSFAATEGVWEVDSGQTHNSAGAVYVLTTVRDNVVSFEAYDKLGSESFKKIESWSVVVGTSTNSPPVLNAIGNRTANEGVLLSLTATATDPDSGQTLTFSLVNPPAGASITSGGVLSWTPTEAQGPGTHTITVRVTDNGSPAQSAQQSFTVTVNEVNSAPSLNPIAVPPGTVGTPVTFTAVGTDTDVPANTLTYSLSGAPSGASLNAITGAFSWTPSAAGSFPFTVVVTDNGSPQLSASQLVTITVTQATTNQPPVLNAIANQTVNEGALLNLTATATDPDAGQTLTFSLVNPPAGASITSGGAFSWTPTEAQGPGAPTVTVRVTDNGSLALSAEQSFVVTVNEVNRTPTLAAIAEQRVRVGRLVAFTASASDADIPVNTLTYSLVGTVPSGATINATTGAFRWTPSSIGTYTLRVRVTDSGTPNLFAEQSFTVSVRR